MINACRLHRRSRRGRRVSLSRGRASRPYPTALHTDGVMRLAVLLALLCLASFACCEDADTAPPQGSGGVAAEAEALPAAAAEVLDEASAVAVTNTTARRGLGRRRHHQNDEDADLFPLALLAVVMSQVLLYVRRAVTWLRVASCPPSTVCFVSSLMLVALCVGIAGAIGTPSRTHW